MKNKLSRLLITLISIVLVLAVILVSFGVFTARRSFPQWDGEVQLRGLDGVVEIYRDAYGIPHIFATTAHDLFFSQGYVHAQDRFWQMDFWRHIGSGRLSEMLGAAMVEDDQFLRNLGWERIAKQEYEMMDDEMRSILQAYADGVNAYLAEHQGSELSLEYAIVKLLAPEYQPEPWQPIHTITWAKVMAWDLKGNLGEEIERAILLSALSEQQVDELFPPYPAEHPVIVPEFSPQARLNQPFSAARRNYTEHALLLNTYKRLAQKFAAIDEFIRSQGEGLGSNNWVISGKLTATGTPILANDPHLGVQIPSIWYEIGLYCVTLSEDCPYRVTGFSFAGAPGVIIGHNQHIAWGMTNVGPDVIDLYIEKINPENPNQYEVNGAWVDMELVQETIHIAGGEPQQVTLRYTRHGPVISDGFGALEDFDEKAGIELPSPYAISMRWTALEPAYVFRAILGFDHATSWEEFRQAARDFAVPAQNLVYADVEGNIGYQMPGKIPIRKNGDGLLPVPGWTDEYEWEGYIPFEELPYVFNPEKGYVVTANNAVVGEDYPYLISRVWTYGYRAQRIVDMIENAPGKIDIAYVQTMQGDNYDFNAEKLVPLLLQLPLQDDRLERARDLLQNWDFQSHMDSAAAALFNAFWKALLERTFWDELPEDYRPEGDSRWLEVVHNLIEQPQSAWWDDLTTPQIEDRDQIFLAALAQAVTELEATLGKDPSRWTWGDLHLILLRHQSLGSSGIAPIEALFNRGPYRTSGGSAIVNATGWNAEKGYEVLSIPSMRMIVDMGDLAHAWAIHPTGQSGHAFHPHYVDLIDMWRLIQYHPMLWDKAEIQAQAQYYLRLIP